MPVPPRAGVSLACQAPLPFGKAAPPGPEGGEVEGAQAGPPDALSKGGPQACVAAASKALFMYIRVLHMQPSALTQRVLFAEL